MLDEGLRLGMSLYLSEPAEQNLARVARCPERGITQAFTSLHIPEDDNVDRQPALLRELGAAATAAGVRLYADVSPLTLRRLALAGSDDAEQLAELADWGVAGVRFDDGFPMATIAHVSRRMPVQLNASTVTADDTDLLLDEGAQPANVEVLHNYYPRVDTGLSRRAYGQANLRFRCAGFRVGAFVAGDGILRGPLHVGLPTLEEHRGVDPVLAAVDLWRGPEADAGADTIYVGDIDLDPQTWQRWAHLAQGAVPLRWTCAAGEGSPERAVAELFSGRVLSNRADETDLVVRVREARPMIGEPGAIDPAVLARLTDAPGAGRPRPRGSVAIDNAGYGRYAGETQLVRVDRPGDPRVTVVGQIVPADLPLLDLLPGGARFVLIETTI